MTVQELQDRRVEINSATEAILVRAEAEKRDLAEEEQKELDDLIGEFKAKSADIERINAVAAQVALLNGSSRKTQPEDPRVEAVEEIDEEPARPAMNGRKPDGIRTPRRHGGTWGWRSLGEFAMAVRHGSMPGGHLDQRFMPHMAPTTYGTEGVGADGGFAVPPDFRAAILSKVMGEDQLISRTDQMTCSGNSITMPVDTATPWQTTGGILAYWDGEAQQLNQSKPALEQVQIKLNKLTALVPVSDELLEDAPALDVYLRRKIADKMTFKVNHGIVSGTGVGQPLGIMNSPSLVTQADANGSYIAPVDIFRMWSRMYGPLRSSAVWLVNQDVEPELFSMVLPVTNVAGTENVGGGPVYLPANGLSSSPFATLMGRPVIPTEACNSLNTPGDIIFVNLSQYMTVTKGGGIRTDTSIHLFFDYGMTAFRAIFRMAGRSWWDSTITPRSGSANTLTWAVALDTRT